MFGPASAPQGCNKIVPFTGVVSSGQLGHAVSFLLRYPEALVSISVLSLSATVGMSFDLRMLCIAFLKHVNSYAAEQVSFHPSNMPVGRSDNAVLQD